MAVAKPGHRITILLPVNTVAERIAAANVVGYVNGTFHGSTVSADSPAVFLGHWDSGSMVYVDQVILIQTDVADDGDTPALLDLIQTLRDHATADYQALGSPQTEFWVTLQSLSLITG